MKTEFSDFIWFLTAKTSLLFLGVSNLIPIPKIYAGVHILKFGGPHSIYILSPVVFFAELVQIGLWAVWA